MRYPFFRILSGICICLIFALLSFNILTAQSIKYEAEAGTLTGRLSIQNTQPGYSGIGYAGRLLYASHKNLQNANVSLALFHPGIYIFNICSSYGSQNYKVVK